MDKKLNIICDCDNVLLNFTKGFSEWHNSTYNDFSVSENPHNFYFDVDDSNREELESRLKTFWLDNTMSMLDKMEPEVDIKFKELRSLHNVIICSAVPEYVRDYRMENLEDFDIDSSGVFLIPDKVSVITSNTIPDICIDDSPDNIKKFVDAGITVFYPNYFNYTKDLDIKGAMPYSDWDDLLNQINTL